MQRYFIPIEQWLDNKVILTDSDAHHITRVMRQEVGDTIICVHPNGEAAICIITDLSKRDVHAEVNHWLEIDAELPIEVTIAQGLPKGNKLELILQKGTELGARKFCLIQADRSIAKWDSKKAAQRMKRYEKIMQEASEQSHRNFVPEIKEAVTIKQLLAHSETYDFIIFAYEDEAKSTDYSSLSTSLQKIKPNDRVLVFIGPEGGFSDQEVQLLKENNCTPVRLGRRILRTETASLYVLASISYHFEELPNRLT